MKTASRRQDAKPPRHFPAAERPSDLSLVPWCLGGLLVLTAIVFLRSLGNGFVFDDLDQVVNNRYLGDWSFIWKSMVNNALWFRDPASPPALSYYRPFQNVWFALNFHLFGLNPAGWHAAQAALHLVVVWLVYRVASLLSGNQWTGLLAAALFAVMPIRAEPIVCVFAIGTPMSAAFELAAFECYLRRSLALSLALFAFALLSHDCAIVFPALIAAHAFLLQPDRSYRSYKTYSLRARAAIAAAWPYLLEAAAYVGLRLWVLGFLSAPNPSNPPISVLETALTIPSALIAYLQLLAMPWRAGPAHPLSIVHSAAAPEFYLPMLELLAISGALYIMLRNRPHRRLYLFCAAWFLIALAPILDLNVLFFQAAIQDRYLYLPSVGICLAAADLVVSFAIPLGKTSPLTPLPSGEGNQQAKIASRSPSPEGRGGQGVRFFLPAAAVVLAFAAMLFHAQAYWRDQAAMMARCIRDDPDAVFCHDRLGMALEANGGHSAARRELEKAIALAPDNGMYRYDLGMIDERLGDRTAAAREMAAGLALLNRPPASGYTRLAIVADAAGDSAAAEAALARAAALPGGAVMAAVVRAQILRRHRDFTGSERALRDIIDRHPDNPQAYAALAMTLEAEGRHDQAIEAYRRAAALLPNEPSLHPGAAN